jgi:hypothetical protein
MPSRFHTEYVRTPMRIGRDVEVRPLGGRAGCLAMVLFSVAASVILTVVVNLLVR